MNQSMPKPTMTLYHSSNGGNIQNGNYQVAFSVNRRRFDSTRWDQNSTMPEAVIRDTLYRSGENVQVPYVDRPGFGNSKGFEPEGKMSDRHVENRKNGVIFTHLFTGVSQEGLDYVLAACEANKDHVRVVHKVPKKYMSLFAQTKY